MFKNFRVFLIFNCAIPLLMLLSCGNKGDAKSKSAGRPKDIKAEGYILKSEVFQNDYTASGTLLANEEIEIQPEISGRVTSINFKEGSYVNKGQTLVQLFDADIRAEIQKLQAQKALQNRLQERQNELLRIGGISRQDFETTKTSIAGINADIEIQEALLRRTRIVAPFSGVIGLRNISNGAVISPITTIATLKQINPLKMDFTVPAQYHKNLQNGKIVFFNVAGVAENLSGKIIAVEPGADMTTRSIRVRAIVPNKAGRLIAGAFAEITIPFQSDNDALLIPTQSVIPTTREKKVAIVKNGKAAFVVVELGTRTSDKVEVITGLQSGDTILTTGLMQVKEGMDVTITKIKS